MSNNSTYICRLCFGIDVIFGEKIEDIHKEILDVLLINIDWSLTETSTLCENCCKKLHESFTFKANCIDIEDYLTPMKGSGKLDLRRVCTLPKHSKAVDLICRLCVEWIDDQEVTLTEKEKEWFKLQLPEIDLNSTSNPVICSECYDSFRSCLSFTERCIQNEQKLVDYCKNLKMTNESPIFLNEFLEYWESPNSSTRVGHLNRKVGSEKLDEFKYDVCSYASKKVTDIEAHKVSHVNSSQQLDFDADLKICIKEEYLSELANRTQECCLCNFKAFDEWGLDRHIRMEHKNSNVEKKKAVYISQKRHVCSICDYQTSRPSNLRQHMVKHSDTPSFKCDECSFESKRAHSVSNHKIIHRNPSEVKMFKCDECPYESKWADSISKHKKVHRKPSELNMFKCDECPFESKRAHSVSNHKIIHRNPSEVNMFKCEECPFESKWSTSLISHKKIHRKPSEVNVFKCDECPYECKRNDRLSDHKKIHRKPSEVNMFKCDECSFESKWAHSLSNHKKIHRNPSEVDMFKCEECPFESKRTQSFSNHKKIHRKPSEVDMFKCEECPFESKRTQSFSNHKKIHRKPSEVNMFKCDECPFESKWVKSLIRHKKIHRKPSEVHVFKCDECPFESKWAESLTRHKIIHRKPSEVNMQERYTRG